MKTNDRLISPLLQVRVNAFSYLKSGIFKISQVCNEWNGNERKVWRKV